MEGCFTKILFVVIIVALFAFGISVYNKRTINLSDGMTSINHKKNNTFYEKKTVNYFFCLLLF